MATSGTNSLTLGNEIVFSVKEYWIMEKTKHNPILIASLSFFNPILDRGLFIIKLFHATGTSTPNIVISKTPKVIN